MSLQNNSTEVVGQSPELEIINLGLIYK